MKCYILFGHTLVVLNSLAESAPAETFSSLRHRPSSSRSRPPSHPDWFEANGPDDSCGDVPDEYLRTESGSDPRDDRRKEKEVFTLFSRVDVCDRAQNDDEKCICVRGDASSRSFRLKCGRCRLRFIAEGHEGDDQEVFIDAANEDDDRNGGRNSVRKGEFEPDFKHVEFSYKHGNSGLFQ